MSPTLTSSGTRGVEKSPAERRRSSRDPYIIDAWLVPAGERQTRMEVVTLNLSRHGVGFQLPAPLSLGSTHTLELSACGKRITMNLVVRRCMPADADFWEIGAEFC